MASFFAELCLSTPASYVEVLTPISQGITVLADREPLGKPLKEIIKTKSLGWVLVQRDWCLHKKEIRTHTEGRCCEDTARWPPSSRGEASGETGPVHSPSRSARRQIREENAAEASRSVPLCNGGPGELPQLGSVASVLGPVEGVPCLLYCGFHFCHFRLMLPDSFLLPPEIMQLILRVNCISISLHMLIIICSSLPGSSNICVRVCF